MRAIRRLLALLSVWRRRAYDRRMLAAMSNRALQDIGLTRSDARREVGKPCWRP